MNRQWIKFCVCSLRLLLCIVTILTQSDCLLEDVVGQEPATSTRETSQPRSLIRFCRTSRHGGQTELVAIGGYQQGRIPVVCRDELWKCFSPQVVGQLFADRKMLAKIQPVFEFSPHSTIRRVVYIGTPHGGSIATNSAVGRVANRLTAFPDEFHYFFDALRASGVDSLPARLPTAVDHLSPGNAVLATVASLPVAPGVKTHSIIGYGYRTPPRSLGDRIVTVENARTGGVESELLVRAKHTSIHHAAETIAELKRILWEHARVTLR